LFSFRPVVNQTELEGSFNFKLEWTPETAKAVTPRPDGAAIESGPSIFTAIQQQLGLRLRSKKMPVEVVVIDHVERPSEN
jgi:uncharacterized protein (TIGR03435 family)